MVLFYPSLKTKHNQLKKKLHQKEQGESLADEVPETKKMELSECENFTEWHSDIMKEEMLSDVPINIAQCLLKKQFPNLKGLQPTVNQQKKQQLKV